jgi:hypothetical protein
MDRDLTEKKKSHARVHKDLLKLEKAIEKQSKTIDDQARRQTSFNFL